jgi:hypothetical protein
MILRSKVLITLLILGASACSHQFVQEPERYQPKLVPEGWYADFDYQSPLPVYLANKVDLANRESKVLFLFLFGDTSTDRILKGMGDPKMAALFEEKMVVMVHSQWLRDLFLDGEIPRPNIAAAAPVFIPLDSNGEMAGPILFGAQWHDHMRGDRYRVFSKYFPKFTPDSGLAAKPE